MRAFVIDDSKPVRGILVKMLKGLQFDTTEAENGQQALDCLADQEVPDVFLVNWNMPVLNGLEFIERIKADKNYANVPLLVVSGESRPTTIARATAAGANGYLVKPVSSTSLRDSLVSIGVSLPTTTPKALSPPDVTTPGLTPRQTPASTRQPSAASRISNPNSANSVTTQAIRVLVVDDSVVVRGIVSKMLQEDPCIEVVGTAADGVIALAKLKQHDVDVILLDIEMPRMDGFEVLKALRRDLNQIPVVMFSSLTERGGASTVEALMLGAKDYVMKPGGAYMTDAKEGRKAILEELIPKIKQFAGYGRKPIDSRNAKKTEPLERVSQLRSRIDAVLIGVSTGGPQALAKLIPKLGHDLPVPVLIVQHMPEGFTRHLADRLTTDSGFPVTEAIHGTKIVAGQFLVAPGGYHLAVKRYQTNVMVSLNKNAPINSCRPSANVLFQSATTAYASNVLGVVLTGMGSDGAEGCSAIRQTGGQVIVQDEESSVVWGMPGSVVRSGCADKIVPLEKIADEILGRVWRMRSRNTRTDLRSGGSE